MGNAVSTFINGNKPVLYVLAIAFLLRLAWAFLIPVDPVSDSVMYDRFAMSLASGDGYSFPDGSVTAYWPVGTSAIYGFLYYIFGHSYTTVVILNIFIGLGTTWMIMQLCSTFFTQRTALIAGLIYALWPSQIQFTTILASELIFNFFVLLGLCFWYGSFTRTGKSIIFASIFFALACYIRPIALLIPFGLIIIDFIHRPNARKVIVNSLLVSISLAMIIAPWAYRNYQVFDAFVLISTNGGPVFWMGNNPDSNSGYMPLPRDDFETEAIRAQYYKNLAVEHISEQPLLFLQRCAQRFIDFFSYETIGVSWNKNAITNVLGSDSLTPLKILSTLYWYLVVLTAIIGAMFLFRCLKLRNWLSATPFISLTLYMVVIHTIIASGDRYHFPIIPFFTILSGYFLANLPTKLADKASQGLCPHTKKN